MAEFGGTNEVPYHFVILFIPLYFGSVVSAC